MGGIEVNAPKWDDPSVYKLYDYYRKLETLCMMLCNRQEALRNGKDQYGQDDQIYNIIEKMKFSIIEKENSCPRKES